jgi:hypothetical protein
MEAFSKERAEVWKSQGNRFGHQNTQRQHKEGDALPPPSQEQITGIVDYHMSALEEVLNIINTTCEPLQSTKDNALKSWLAIRTLESYRLKYIENSSSISGTESSQFCIMHPALKAAFEAAYPTQHPDHRDLRTIDFGQFFSYGIGEEMFAQLTFKIESKFSDLVQADNFVTHWEAFATKLRPPEESLLQSDEDFSEQPTHLEQDFLENPSFKSIYRMAEVLDALKWMFEERQDILATFVQQIAVPMEAMQPRLDRIRSRRD